MQFARSRTGDSEAARRRLELIASGLDDTDEPQPIDASVALREAEPTGEREVEPVAVTKPAQVLGGRHAARAPTPWSRWQGRLLDTVPATMRGRWGITAQHVTVVALVVASALAVAAWWVVRAQPEPVIAPPVVVPSPSPAQSSVTSLAGGAQAVPSGAARSPGAGRAGSLVVHVAGKVRRPGIVTVPAGSRVIDAVQRAGGPRRDVDLSGLNLARPLADGEQIFVGAAAGGAAPPASAAPGAPGAPTGPVNLNTATSAQLEELPGVGPVTAASILEWRTEHGRFSTVEELLEVSGIGEATLADLRELVTV